MMKKILLTAIGAALISTAFAQKTVTPEDGLYCNEGWDCIPTEFTYGNKPLLELGYRDGRTVYTKMKIYDENIDLVKSVDIDQDRTFNYTLAYTVQSREAKVSKTKEDTVYVYREYDYDHHEYTKFDNVDSFMGYIGHGTDEYITTALENGDTLIKPNRSDYDNSYVYYKYSYFGLQYPCKYWLLSNGVGYEFRAEYTVEYTDWQDVGTKNVDQSVKIPVLRIGYSNLDNKQEEFSFYMSQTLFNTDEDFEYLTPKYSLSATNPRGDNSQYSGGTTYSDDEIVTERTAVASGQKSNVVMTGFQVVSSDGNVVSDLDFEDGFEADLVYNKFTSVITLGGNTYLAFQGYVDGKWCYVFYKIDRTANSIKKVKAVPAGMVVNPAVVNKNADINVSFGDANEGGSDVVVVSATGAKVKAINVPAGQTRAQVSVSGPTGVYCVSRLQKGKVSETKKIVVK